MRFSFVVGAAVVVILVAAIAFMSLRSGQPADEDTVTNETTELDTESGQFFQEIPDNASESLPSQDDLVTDEPSPAAATSAGEAVTITISESGFSPATATVAPGTEVTFVNNGQAAHWPASDVHPTHAVLSGFDAKRGLGTGESYSYTFTEVGTWRCHDHLMPHFSCTIVVK